MRKAPLIGALASTLLLSACTGSLLQSGPAPSASTSLPAKPVTVVDAPTGAAMAISAAIAVWQKSQFAVVAPKDDSAAGDSAAEAAKRLKAPMYFTTPTDLSALSTELKRIGATKVLAFGDMTGVTLEGVSIVTKEDDLPDQTAAAPLSGLAVMTSEGLSQDVTAALATLEAAGASELPLAHTDPRIAAEDVKAVSAAKPAHVVALGREFGQPQRLATRIGTAATGVQLPGGGQTIFDNKRYVALYGSPETSALGVLGEQGAAESVTRAKQVAGPYQSFTKDTIVPAFEIISTVASAEAGKDGDYSRPAPLDALRPLITEAGKNGVYVVLDLQPGRTDFLTQAKTLTELLKLPHVGLALDPEWRLKPGERHLRQIGSVTAAEINTVITWLSDLVAKEKLPQKMLLLHQFRLSMIKNRETLDTSHDEIAMVVQMDGDGTHSEKQTTWTYLQTDAPKALKFGWKNFYDEDEPTPTEQYTMQEVKPQPYWVSYQ